jgi:arylformamidase
MVNVPSVVDLSHELYNNMPGLGGSVAVFWPQATHAESSQISQGQVSSESHMILISEHISTHFDCPSHFDPEGLSTEKYPLERLVLPGLALDFSGWPIRKPILPNDFEAATAKVGKTIQPGSAVLAHTGQDANWGTPGFSTNRPYLPPETAEWLVGRGVLLFGTDLIGVDEPGDWRWKTHNTFLRANVPMVQQMRNINALFGKDFLLVVLPLKMRDGTGCPVRPVGLVFD